MNKITITKEISQKPKTKQGQIFKYFESFYIMAIFKYKISLIRLNDGAYWEEPIAEEYFVLPDGFTLFQGKLELNAE